MIVRLLLAFLVALLCTGASCSRFVRGEAVPAECEAVCFLPCTVNGDTGVRWEADPNDPQAWDELAGGTTEVLATKLRTCDARRGACVQCLRRLHRHGVIDLGPYVKDPKP